MVPLNQDAQFHPDGVLSRACDLCWSAYQRWLEVRSSRLSKIQSVIDAQKAGENAQEDLTVDSDSTEASQDDAAQSALPAVLSQTSEISASVPRDWNWSTF